MNTYPIHSEFAVFDNLLEGCQVIGEDWRYLYLNDCAAKHGRRKKEELIGKKITEEYPGIENTELFSIMQQVIKERRCRLMENEFTFPDGSKGWFELRIEPIPQGLFILSLDISERKRNELRVKHLLRLFATLSAVNQTIVRVTNRDDLFASICKVAVDVGEFGLAWIGVIDHNSGEVTPVAVFGKSHERLPFKAINYKESPFKNGLTGRSIILGDIIHSRDIQTDPAMEHWREMSIEGGYRAAASIPFRFKGEIVGIVQLFSTDADFFEDKEQEMLLREMAVDISFALDSME